jgi:alkylation response protein AidB-like acyl-CoA dehydrogenase
LDYFPLFLSKQDQMIAKVIRKFVDHEIMPVRDQIDDDLDHALINKILKKLSGLGLDGGISLIEQSKEEDFEQQFHVTSSIIVEELSRGDTGIGIVNALNGWVLLPAFYAGNQTVLDLYTGMAKTKSPALACFAMTEADGGCDIENLPLLHGKTIKTTARQNGDEWVIQGAKTMPSNSAISSLYCVVCQTDASKGTDGIALIYVPVDTQGLSFGKFERKAGLQADRNADIYFDDVRVPLSYRASGNGRDAELLKANLAYGRVASAAAAVGCARGAFEEVLKYTGERVVGGKKIREHSIAAGMLAEMATGIETARSFYLQAAYMLSHTAEFGPAHHDRQLCYASMSKNYATEVAISVTNKAMELMGSYGYLRDYHVEKYWRDAKELQLWLGGAQLGRFDIARGYYPYQTTEL